MGIEGLVQGFLAPQPKQSKVRAPLTLYIGEPGKTQTRLTTSQANKPMWFTTSDDMVADHLEFIFWTFCYCNGPMTPNVFLVKRLDGIPYYGSMATQ